MQSPHPRESGRSCAGPCSAPSSSERKSRLDASFDVKPLTRIARRARRRRKKGCARKVWRLLNQANERWGIMRDPDHLQFVTFDPELGGIGVIWHNLRQRFEHDRT